MVKAPINLVPPRAFPKRIRVSQRCILANRWQITLLHAVQVVHPIGVSWTEFVESYMKAHRAQRDDLQSVPSVGPSIAQDLRDLGVTSVAALSRRDPERLYRALNKLTGATQDPCVLYTFRCAVYFARTSHPKPELLKWWNWKGRTLAPSRTCCRPDRKLPIFLHQRL